MNTLINTKHQQQHPQGTNVAEIVPAARQLHADSGISDNEFRKYDTKMYRSRGLRDIAATAGMGALYARGLSESKAFAYYQGMPRTAKNLAKARKASKYLGYGALATMAASRALKYNAMKHDPVYKNRSALYRAASDIINPPTNLEGYYAEYSRPVSPFAVQNNLYKRAAADMDDLYDDAACAAVGGAASYIPWKARSVIANHMWETSKPVREAQSKKLSQFFKGIL